MDNITIAVLINILCNIYFVYAASRSNFIYCLMYFVAGGLIFLYKDLFTHRKYGVIAAILAIASFFIYYNTSYKGYVLLVLYSCILICGIVFSGPLATTLFQNKGVLFISSLSMEMYLCHMFIYRILERLGFLHVLSNDVVNYILVLFFTVSGAVVFSLAIRKFLKIIESKLKQIH